MSKASVLEMIIVVLGCRSAPWDDPQRDDLRPWACDDRRVTLGELSASREV